jgi:hypothetical protein
MKAANQPSEGMALRCAPGEPSTAALGHEKSNECSVRNGHDRVEEVAVRLQTGSLLSGLIFVDVDFGLM